MTDRPPDTTSVEARIASHVTADGSVIVPPRIARWLEHHAGMTADRRIRLRDTDPAAYCVLAALHLAALSSESGINHAVPQQHKAQSTIWISSREAAQTLNVTDRCIRKRCANGQLNAIRVGARWLIDSRSITTRNTAQENTTP